MPRRLSLRNSDLRGAARLAVDATAGLTDLVEAMHERIARVPGFGGAALDGRARGISGLVYKTIRGVTRVAGGTIDGLLGLLAPALNPNDTSIEREAIVAALNGVLGDHLAATGNPLATTMAFRRDGRALVLEPTALAASVPNAGRRLLVLIHGLCMNDLQWARGGHDHGAALAGELGFTPLYLRYNSGLHVSINGRSLAQQMELLLECWPEPIERVVLLAHSMGGLVARSALHYAAQANHRWPARVDDLLFLGTPHHGAPLERAGHWVDVVLGAAPYAAPLARLTQARSAGITDLRHGNLLDDDWVLATRLERGAARPRHVPLPDGLRCYAAAASMGKEVGDLKERLLGDGLVPLNSALGRHPTPKRTLAFTESRQWVAHGINHMELLSHPAVYAQLRHWLA